MSRHEAYSKALEDMAYFYEHGTHMPPLKYPTIPPDKIPQNRWREVYPDVTNQVNRELMLLTIEAQKASQKGFLDGVKPFFQKSFPNNGRWDLQVGHGLPGQVPVHDTKGQLVFDSKGFVKTADQYALFNNQVVRAGYISNYSYGYAVAATGYLKGLSDAGAYYGNLKAGQLGDNPKDIDALHEGYESYWKENSRKKREFYQH